MTGWHSTITLDANARRRPIATATDIHFKLMKWENRSFQHAWMEQSVSQDEALRRLTEMVEENSRKLDAIIEHLDVPYESPAGFGKE